jgi:Xaa-Pro aminopeptidase
MTVPSIRPTEFATRRNEVRTALKGSVGVVFAGGNSASHDHFRPHPHFEYLTGIVHEPDAVLLLDPTNTDESRRDMLFLRPLNREIERWDGYRPEINNALREVTGINGIFRLTHFARMLHQAALRSRSLACLHPLAQHDHPVSPDLTVFRQVSERIPGSEIIDRSDVLANLRAVKSADEVAMIQQAIDITRDAFGVVIDTLAPGMNERSVQDTLEHTYRDRGSNGPAFGTIVGAGLNSTVLHYQSNDQQIGSGDLVCIDSGAAFGGYGADVTRTLPADGRFTARQREVYQIVLEAEEAAIGAVRPGVRLTEIDKVARAVIAKAGYADAFIHGTGHHLGLETHDVTPDEPLRAGAVITIEPGIYLPDEKIGIRIEDDVLVSKDGPAKVLSGQIPKTVKDIEKRMQSAD